MATITITLPEELAEQAKAQELPSSSAIEAYARDKLRKTDECAENGVQRADQGFDPRLEGLVNPAAFRKGKILSDIVGPFHDEWGTTK